MKALPRSRAASVALAFLGLALPLQAAVHEFTTALDGPSEDPPNASPGTGTAGLVWDTTAKTFTLEVSFSGLLGTTTAAHIHAPTFDPGTGTASVATQLPFFVGFPLVVTSGSYLHTFDLTDPTTYSPGFLGGAGGGDPEAAAGALLTALLDGKAYFNLHSSVFGGGEIRGFFRSAHGLPDEGATLPLLVGASLALAGLGRRREA